MKSIIIKLNDLEIHHWKDLFKMIEEQYPFCTVQVHEMDTIRLYFPTNMIWWEESDTAFFNQLVGVSLITEWSAH